MRIKQLPKEIYDLIAAGEVVLGPVSVVKELVENCFDAGATRIIAEITEGGIERIRVSDNGAGIEGDDIELAFMPHATSKLKVEEYGEGSGEYKNAEALANIETLGFRGEALASIAAVSSVTLSTKTKSEDIGVSARIEGGSALQLTPAGMDAGTDVIVQNLFFNIPARKKHLGDSRTEGRKIAEYLSKAAVSFPDVAFRFISDGSLVFATLGNGDRLSAIAAVYGSKTAEILIPVSESREGMSLEGYVSGVLGLRRNRKGQHFFVNQRPVANPLIEASISRAYREFAEPGRFPVAHLFLTITPALVDVNVHPAKNEVSFANPAEVSDFVYKSILDLLRSGNVIPKLRAPGLGNAAPGFSFPLEDGGESVRNRNGGWESYTDRNSSSDEDSKSNGDWAQNGDSGERGCRVGAGFIEETRVSTSGGGGERVNMVDINDLLSSNQVVDSNILSSSTAKSPDPGAEAATGYENTDRRSNPVYEDTGLAPGTDYDATGRGSQYGYEEVGRGWPGMGFAEVEAGRYYFETLKIEGLQILACLFATYVLASDGDVFYIIDQHAAHERINYERFRKAISKGDVEMQGILIPYLFTPPATIGNMASYIEFFEKIGYQIDEFGSNTWAVRTFPAFIGYTEGEAFFLECLETLGESDSSSGKGQPVNEASLERVIRRACKASVKANMNLSENECHMLLESLAQCENPYTCPHGRPVFLKLTKKDIERLFKRI